MPANRTPPSLRAAIRASATLREASDGSRWTISAGHPASADCWAIITVASPVPPPATSTRNGLAKSILPPKT